MKIKSILLALLVAVTAANNCEAKIMRLLNFDKGDMPSSFSGCEMGLAEENFEKGCSLSLKAVFSKIGWVGEYAPKKACWTGFKQIKFSAFNAADKNVTLTFVVKDQISNGNREGKKTWIVLPFPLKPGMNEVTLSLEGAKAQDGRSIDLKKIIQWHLSFKMFPEESWEEKGSDSFTVFISNIRLEN